MATLDGGDSDLPNEVWDIINCVATYYEKDVRAGMPSFGRKVLSPDFKESEDAESFERNRQVCLRAIPLNMVMKNHYISLLRRQKKTKQ